MRRALPVLLSLAALAAPAGASASDLLPDLVQDQPSGLQVSQANGVWRLGFNSAVINVGPGRMVLQGHRDSTSQPLMTADQVIDQQDGSTRTVPAVAQLQFVQSEDHNHWHMLGFEHYELRRASDYKLVTPDHKTGFCLTDDLHPYDHPLPNERPGNPEFHERCGLGQPDALTVREGISVGWADQYVANLEGQFLDLTNAPGGEYYLVHRVNVDHRLIEARYSDNAASVLIAISRPNGPSGAPAVDTLRGCPTSDWCPGANQQPPALAAKAARRFALDAVRRAFGANPKSVKATCSAPSGPAGNCRTRWKRGPAAYSAGVALAYVRTREGRIYWTWTVRAKRGSKALPKRQGRVRIR